MANKTLIVRDSRACTEAPVSYRTLGTRRGPGWVCVTFLLLDDLAVIGQRWVAEMEPGPSMASWPPVSQTPAAV